MGRPVRICLFCGSSGPLTREHVISRWVSRIYHEDSGPRSYFTMRWPRERTSKDVDYIVKDICARCNSTWLSDLEVRAQALLVDRVRGNPAWLTVDDKLTIATWAVKTAMLMIRVARDHSDAVPLEHYTRFRAAQRPLPEHFVWLAGYQPRARESKCHIQTFEVNGGGHAYYCTLQMGCLVLHVFGHDLAEPQQVGPPGGESYAWQLWPEQQYDVLWPPPQAYDADTIKNVLEIQPTTSEPTGR